MARILRPSMIAQRPNRYESNRRTRARKIWQCEWENRHSLFYVNDLHDSDDGGGGRVSRWSLPWICCRVDDTSCQHDIMQWPAPADSGLALADHHLGSIPSESRPLRLVAGPGYR